MSSATSTPVNPEIRNCSRSTLLFLAGAEGVSTTLAVKCRDQPAAADDVAVHRLHEFSWTRRSGQVRLRVERVQSERVSMRCGSRRAWPGIADVIDAVLSLARAVCQLLLRRDCLR